MLYRYIAFHRVVNVRVYLLRLRIVGCRGCVPLLAAAALVDVELGAERFQRPLLLKSTLKS